jgi:hypothetical protein
MKEENLDPSASSAFSFWWPAQFASAIASKFSEFQGVSPIGVASTVLGSMTTDSLHAGSKLAVRRFRDAVCRISRALPQPTFCEGSQWVARRATNDSRPGFVHIASKLPGFCYQAVEVRRLEYSLVSRYESPIAMGTGARRSSR